MSRLIDADALLKKLDDSIWYNVADFNEAWYAVDHAPTVDAVQVRYGHWIEDPDDWECQCSECRHLSSCRTVYCSACGARMYGKGNSDETD